jgi:hypothetical protein
VPFGRSPPRRETDLSYESQYGDDFEQAVGARITGMDVRRLAAIDMWGTRGTVRRRRIILAEFLIGLPVMLTIGALLTWHAGGPGTRLLGLWMLGAGLNYAPLAYHAIRLSRPGALDAALAGVDTDRELRRYTLLQFWIFIPLSLAVFSLADLRRTRR